MLKGQGEAVSADTTSSFILLAKQCQGSDGMNDKRGAFVELENRDEEMFEFSQVHLLSVIGFCLDR